MKPGQGTAFWNGLHAFTQAYPDAPTSDDIIAAQDFLDDFAARLRKAAGNRCRCADEWDDMVEWVPPPLHDKEVFVLWAIAAHDRVNKLLMKPLFYKRSALHPFLLPRRPVTMVVMDERGAGESNKKEEVRAVRVTRKAFTPCGGGCGGSK